MSMSKEVIMKKKLMICVLVLFSGTANAECIDYVEQVSKEYSVPKSILETIIKAESSNNAYALNFNRKGKSVIADNENEAYKLVKENKDKNKDKNVDIGCGQINLKWHYKFFSEDVDEAIKMMLIPENNVKYAGYFLRTLYEATGKWSKAVGMYHSSNEEFSEKYKNNAMRILKEDVLKK